MNRLVNFSQTPQERREKYSLLKSLGVNPSTAHRMRDWRLAKIERLFHLCFDEHHNKAPTLKPYAQILLPGFTLTNMGIPIILTETSITTGNDTLIRHRTPQDDI